MALTIGGLTIFFYVHLIVGFFAKQRAAFSSSIIHLLIPLLRFKAHCSRICTVFVSNHQCIRKQSIFYFLYSVRICCSVCTALRKVKLILNSFFPLFSIGNKRPLRLQRPTLHLDPCFHLEEDLCLAATAEVKVEEEV